MALLICCLTAIPFLLLFNIVDIKLIKFPLVEGRGAVQSISVVVGGLLLLVLPIAWMGSLIFTFSYLDKGVKDGSLIRRFALLASMVLYLYPMVVLIYHLAMQDPQIAYWRMFPAPFARAEWVMAGGGLLLGTLFLYINRSLARAQERSRRERRG